MEERSKVRVTVPEADSGVPPLLDFLTPYDIYEMQLNNLYSITHTIILLYFGTIFFSTTR